MPGTYLANTKGSLFVCMKTRLLRHEMDLETTCVNSILLEPNQLPDQHSISCSAFLMLQMGFDPIDHPQGHCGSRVMVGSDEFGLVIANL